VDHFEKNGGDQNNKKDKDVLIHGFLVEAYKDEM